MMPPIIAWAIGPQKISRAIRTSPRLAAAAVSMIGRMRCSVASTTACHVGRPACLSSSICTINITEFRTKMPINASTPRIATNPRGAPLGSSARTTPITAERRDRKHQEQPMEALQLAGLARKVYSIEIIEELGQRAKKDFYRQGYTNIELNIAHGYHGWSEHAPSDKVIVTAARADRRAAAPAAIQRNRRELAARQAISPCADRYGGDHL